MIEPFDSSGETIRQLVALLMLYLPRTMAFMWFFPLFNKGSSSNLIKTMVGTVLVLYPAYAAMSASGSVGQMKLMPASLGVITFMSEVALGTLLGLTMAIPYYAFKAFGALADVYRGATFAGQVTGNDAGEELPLETLFGYMFTALIFAGPGLHAVTAHLLNSYLLFTPGVLATESLSDWIMQLITMVADGIKFSVLLSAPILLAIMIVEMAVQIISAFTQQLQVYNLQYGFRSVFGVAGLFVVLNFAEQEMFDMFGAYSRSINELLGAVR